MSDLRERLAEALAEAMSGYIDNGESIHLDMSAGKGVLERLAQNGWHLAQTEYSGMIERLQDALERERKRVEHYATKEADAEATLRKRESELETLFAAAHAAVTYRNERTLDNLAATMLLWPQPARADAEATIQRLREMLHKEGWPDREIDQALADTAPESER